MYFNTSPYVEIISGINTIFSFSDGVVKLTGPRGTGKSALLRELANELRGEGMEVVIFDSLPRSSEELQDYLVRKLELPADVGFRKALLRHLHIRPRDRQRLILVIDDAERINVETLKSISSLRRLENDSQCFINVLLCGESSLDKLLANPELTELSGDISMQYQLHALDFNQLAKFCGSYLNYIGKGHYQLSVEHLDMLHRDSQGLPGQVLEHLGEHLTDPSFLLSLSRPENVGLKSPSRLIDEPPPSGLDNIRTLLAEGYKDWLKLISGAAVTLTIASVLYGTSGYWSRYLVGTVPDRASAATVLPTPAQPVPPVTIPETNAGETVPRAPAAADPAPAAVNQTPPPQTTPVPVPVAPPVTPPVAATEPAATAANVPPPAAEPTQQEAATNRAPAMTAPTNNTAAPGNTALRASIDAWAAAWQRQDVDGYLAAYHSDFKPQYHNSVSSWRNDRIRNLTRPASITINITDFEIIATSAQDSTVRFSQEYSSPAYADRTQKELVLSRDQDGQLRILRELNHEVVKLPAGRVTATTATATQLPPQPGTAIPDRDSINQFINSWLNAWQGKDVAAYLGHYHPDYKPDSAASVAEWRSDRELKIKRPTFIQLQLQKMEIIEQLGAETLVRLTLEYRSNFYADRTIKLVRVQRREDGNLQIIMERNTLVETMALARMTRPAPQGIRDFSRAIVERTF